MAKDRAFILLTYKLYGHLSKVGGQKKSNCINVLLALLKYAWKKNNYKCAVRYATLSKDTGLAKVTVRRTILSLAKLNVVKVKRLASANEYVINETFMRTERVKLDHSGVSNKISIIKRNNIKEIDDIISKGYDKEKLIEQLSKLPLALLKKDNVNLYYTKLAMALKEENEKPKVELNTGQVLREMSKKTNMNYKMKVAYNKRNSIKPWENK